MVLCFQRKRSSHVGITRVFGVTILHEDVVQRHIAGHHVSFREKHTQWLAQLYLMKSYDSSRAFQATAIHEEK